MNRTSGPKVAFLLLAYRQAETIADAVRGALAQDWSGLDILVSDDASPDATADIARTVGGDRVRVRVGARNLGLMAHLAEAASELPDADLIVVAAGDDISEPTRVRRLVEAWEEAGRPTPAYLYSDVTPIDPSGRRVEEWGETVVRPPWTVERLADGGTGPLGATAAFTADLLVRPSPVDPCVRHEDRVLPFRALLLGGAVLFVNEALVRYRIAGGVSRDVPTSGIDRLTRHAAALLSRTLPDSVQRLSDACSAGAAPAVIARCERQLAKQRAQLAMASGRPLRAAISALRAGAPLAPVLTHLARFLRARLTGR